ncbi:MAG TPA: hypothetical protein VE615_02995 [Gaiellaceae bacterium]|jgi:hypothetical protein|nr:hypothetical protein [Gaiellaceae bacterium]
MGTVLVFALIVAPLASILAWVLRRDRLRLVLMVAVLAAAALWLVVIAVILTGWRDLDGFVDCSACTTGQQATAVAFWVFPGLGLVLAFASTATLLLRR